MSVGIEVRRSFVHLAEVRNVIVVSHYHNSCLLVVICMFLITGHSGHCKSSDKRSNAAATFLTLQLRIVFPL